MRTPAHERTTVAAFATALAPALVPCPQVRARMTEQTSARLWLARAGLAGCILMAAIIVSSAYLRLTAMGIGCEPWPGCYGRMQALPPAAQKPAAASTPESVTVARLLHRAAAMLVAILAVMTLLLSLTGSVRNARNVSIAASILALTVMLAAVGRMSATLLVPAVGIANLLGGFGLLACFWVLRLDGCAIEPRKRVPPRVRRIAGCMLLVLALQAAAGALISVTYSADLCASLWGCDAGQGSERALHLFDAQRLDANGKVIAVPGVARIQAAHRVLGIAAAVLFVLFGLSLVRSPTQRVHGAALAALASIEAAIGIAMAAHGFPLLAAMAHNAIAAALLLVLVGLAWPSASVRASSG